MAVSLKQNLQKAVEIKKGRSKSKIYFQKGCKILSKEVSQYKSKDFLIYDNLITKLLRLFQNSLLIETFA